MNYSHKRGAGGVLEGCHMQEEEKANSNHWASIYCTLQTWELQKHNRKARGLMQPFMNCPLLSVHWHRQISKACFDALCLSAWTMMPGVLFHRSITLSMNNCFLNPFLCLLLPNMHQQCCSNGYLGQLIFLLFRMTICSYINVEQGRVFNQGIHYLLFIRCKVSAPP